MAVGPGPRKGTLERPPFLCRLKKLEKSLVAGTFEHRRQVGLAYGRGAPDEERALKRTCKGGKVPFGPPNTKAQAKTGEDVISRGGEAQPPAKKPEDGILPGGLPHCQTPQGSEQACVDGEPWGKWGISVRDGRSHAPAPLRGELGREGEEDRLQLRPDKAQERTAATCQEESPRGYAHLITDAGPVKKQADLSLGELEADAGEGPVMPADVEEPTLIGLDVHSMGKGLHDHAGKRIPP